MSKGGGTNSTIDSRLFPLLEQNYKSAQNIANTPFTSYSGQMVAPTSAATTQGQNAILSGALTAGQPTLNSAIAGATSVQNYKPVQVKAPAAKATMGQAATSGVYGALAQPAPMSAPVEIGLSVPPSAPATSQGVSFGSSRQARMDRRAARRGSSPAPSQAQPTPPTPTVAAPTGPTVAAMQGLQGLDAYFNPYVGQVADRTLADLDRFRQMSVNQNSSNATLSNAFGGDRQAVTDALTNEAFARQAADTLAGLYSQGFDTSSGLLMSDKDRLLQNQQFNAGLQQQMNLANMGAANQVGLANQAGKLQAALANQSAGLQGAQVNLAGSSTLGNLANQQQQQLLTGANAVTGVGQQQQAQQQAQLDAAYQEFMRQLAYPYQQQQVLNSALGMFGQANNTQQYTMPNYTAVSQNLGK